MAALAKAGRGRAGSAVESLAELIRETSSAIPDDVERALRAALRTEVLSLEIL